MPSHIVKLDVDIISSENTTIQFIRDSFKTPSPFELCINLFEG